MMYTADDARREIRECLKQGYGFSYIRIFLNDLARWGDISWKDNKKILEELAEGKFGEMDLSVRTY